MTPMQKDEVVEFMRTGSRTGKLAVTRADGRPHVTPVWFDFDDDTGELVFLTQVDSIKGKSLRRDGRVSICVDEMEFPFDFARIDGEVSSLTPHDDDPDALLHWSTVTCRRYVGDDRADEYGRRNAHPTEMLVRIRPTGHLGARGIAS